MLVSPQVLTPTYQPRPQAPEHFQHLPGQFLSRQGRQAFAQAADEGIQMRQVA
jgi:hypothetical protein